MSQLCVRLALACATLTTCGALTAPAFAAPDSVRIGSSSLLIQAWEENGVPRYAMSRDGGPFGTAVTTDYTLELRHGAFDALAPAALPAVDERLQQREDARLCIVQCIAPPGEEMQAALEAAGARCTTWTVPHHAVVVRADAETQAALSDLPFVRWVGPYHPAYRLGPRIHDELVYGDAPLETITYNVMAVEASAVAKRRIADQIDALGGHVHRTNAGKYLLEATLDEAQLIEVLHLDDVLFVDPWGPLEPDMDVARVIGGAAELESVAGYTGAGIRGEVIDIGFNVGHVDFASRPLILHTAVDTQSHGASTSGIIFGDGTGSADKRGLLPDAQGIIADTGEVFTGPSRYDHTGELLEAPYYAVFQSSSVGSPQIPNYSSISAETDAMLFDFDILHLQSQSNTGSLNSRPQAWAKNIVSVGAFYHHGTLDTNDDCWGCGGPTAASHGPAEDGRVKPDLAAFYDQIGTVTTSGATSYTEGFGGTSGATPICAGYAGLFLDMWADGIFGNPVDPGASDFDNRPHMTTAKAAMINRARPHDWTAGGANGDMDRAHQGWGVPSVIDLHDRADRTFYVDEDDVIANGQMLTYVVTVPPGEPDLRVTMTFADPPGNPAAALNRVNDLSLRVTSPSSVSYWGNVGLESGLWSVPGGAENNVDTVENVFVPTPEAGNWRVTVIGREIIQDGHVETPTIDADFALWITGVEFSLRMTLASPVPSLVAPGDAVPMQVQISEGSEAVVPGSALLRYRASSQGVFQEIALTAEGDGVYTVDVPGFGCDDDVEFYFVATGDGGTDVTIPGDAPISTLTYEIGELSVLLEENFETTGAWTTENIAVADGQWDRGVPAGAGDRGDPTSDYDGSGACWLTDNEAGNSDLDGGPTILTSPVYDVSGLDDPIVQYARWFTNDDEDVDRLDVEISDNGGASWTLLESVAGTESGSWVHVSYRIADYVAVNDQFRIRFSATDNPNNSVTEAGIDALWIGAQVCEGGPGVPGDVDGDGDVDFEDIVSLLSAWGACGDPCPGDFDGSGSVDFADLLVVLSNWDA